MNDKETVLVSVVNDEEERGALLAQQGDRSLKQPYAVTYVDGVYAVILLVLSYLYVSRVLFGSEAFVLTGGLMIAYIANLIVLVLYKKGAPLRESWYWLVMLLLLAGSYILVGAHYLIVLQGVFSVMLLLYWTMTVFSGLLYAKTTNMLLIEWINGLVVIPFRNSAAVGVAWWRSLRSSRILQGRHLAQNKTLHAVLVGVAVSLPLLWWVVPQLIAADSSGLLQVLLVQLTQRVIASMVRLVSFEMVYHMSYVMLALPLTFYLGALALGLGSQRYTRTIPVQKIEAFLPRLRKMPQMTGVTVLSMLILFYVIYLIIQVNYIVVQFDAVESDVNFRFASFARQGFFELCRIVIANIVVLLTVNMLNTKRANRWMKVFNVFVALLTILLCALAISKMALYVYYLGLTPMRLLVCVFLLFLIGVWSAIIAVQFWRFSLVRFAWVTGICIGTLLCLSNVDARVDAFNDAFRPLAPTLVQQ